MSTAAGLPCPVRSADGLLRDVGDVDRARLGDLLLLPHHLIESGEGGASVGGAHADPHGVVEGLGEGARDALGPQLHLLLFGLGLRLEGLKGGAEIDGARATDAEGLVQRPVEALADLRGLLLRDGLEAFELLLKDASGIARIDAGLQLDADGLVEFRLVLEAAEGRASSFQFPAQPLEFLAVALGAGMALLEGTVDDLQLVVETLQRTGGGVSPREVLIPRPQAVQGLVGIGVGRAPYFSARLCHLAHCFREVLVVPLRLFEPFGHGADSQQTNRL